MNGFVQILYVNGNHWVCVWGILFLLLPYNHYPLGILPTESVYPNGQLTFDMISLSKFLKDNWFLLAQVLSPAIEKNHSIEAEDAGMHSIMYPKLQRVFFF